MFKTKIAGIDDLKDYLHMVEMIHEDMGEFCEKANKTVAADLIAGAVKLTQPEDNRDIYFKVDKWSIGHIKVVGGALRRGWVGGTDKDTGDVSSGEINRYANNLKCTKRGNTFSVNVDNNVSYGPYVEYGHRQNVGQFVPIIGKEKNHVVQGARLKKSWVEGQRMLEGAVENTRKNLHIIIEDCFERFINEHTSTNR